MAGDMEIVDFIAVSILVLMEVSFRLDALAAIAPADLFQSLF